MPNVINGTYTLKQVLLFTNESKFKTRIKTRKRDVLKSITVKKISELKTDRPKEPNVKYEITSYSYPNYQPYYNKLKGRKYQRKIKHQYDIVLEMDRLSLNTTIWKMRVGSEKKYDPKPPQNKIKQVYKETRENIENRVNITKLSDKEKKLKIKNEIDKIKKYNKYLDVGDYNSRVLGINLDFYFRCSVVYKLNGHLFARDMTNHNFPKITNPKGIMFFTKHQINFIEKLMEKGVLKDDYI